MPKQPRIALLAGALVMLSACGSGSPSEEDFSAPVNTKAAMRQTAQELCLNGVHRYPRSNIRVNRAVLAPLARVKKWVLSTDSVDWRTFSASLASAPMDERVGVCVLTQMDGSRFVLPPGENTP